MPKYYVRVTEKLPLVEGAVNPLNLIKDYQEIVDAKNELDACLKVWLRLRIDAKGAVWIVNIYLPKYSIPFLLTYLILLFFKTSNIVIDG